MSQTKQERNKALVLEAFYTLFNKRDHVAAERYWSPTYIQHSAHIAPGREGLFNLIKSMPPTLRYGPGMIVAEGDLVIVHGRFSGFGAPVSWIAADILRIEDGVLVEHWDVIQDEATQEQSKSGRPMFGDSFPDLAPIPAADVERFNGKQEQDGGKFTIEHVHVKTEKPFGEVAAAFEARLGTFDPAVYERLRDGDAPSTVRARLEGMAGPSGFMLFRTSDHGALLSLAGQTRKAVQYLLGNPLFAVRMTRHDIRAGLYAPLRVLLYEDEEGKTCVEYDRPSSLFGQFGNANVTEIAAMLDRKLEQLAAEAIQ